jgi:hypothetical protein
MDKQMKKAVNTVLDAIKFAYGIDIAWYTPTADGSKLSDFPSYDGATERMTERLHFEVLGDESICELAMKVIQQRGRRAHGIENNKSR